MGRSEYRHRVNLFQTVGTRVVDDASWTDDYVPLSPPAWYCAIRPISARERQFLASSQTLTAVTHIVEGDYRPDLDTSTLIEFGARRFYVNAVTNHDERNVRVTLQAIEVAPAQTVNAAAAAEAQP